VHSGHAVPLGVAQQNRQAVRHQHGAGQARGVGDCRIGLQAIGRAGIQAKDLGAMHLVEEHGARRKRRLMDWHLDLRV